MLDTEEPLVVEASVPLGAAERDVAGPGHRLEDEGRGGQFSQADLISLAGNAFCAFTLAPVLISLFAFIDWGSMGQSMGSEAGLGSDVEADLFGDSNSNADTLSGGHEDEGRESEAAGQVESPGSGYESVGSQEDICDID